MVLEGWEKVGKVERRHEKKHRFFELNRAKNLGKIEKNRGRHEDREIKRSAELFLRKKPILVGFLGPREHPKIAKNA